MGNLKILGGMEVHHNDIIFLKAVIVELVAIAIRRIRVFYGPNAISGRSRNIIHLVTCRTNTM